MRKACAPIYDAPSLTTVGEARGNDRLRNPQRNLQRNTQFSDFAETSLIIRSEIKKIPNLAVLQKTFVIGKYSNFNFQNRGFW